MRNMTFPSVMAVLALTACSEPEVILPGERLNVREVLETRADPDAGPVENTTRAAALGTPRANADWAQSPVSAFARTDHAALSGLTPVWSTAIGEGDSRRQRILADPVVGGGRIYTIDSANTVQATTTGGGVAWVHDLTPLRDDPTQAQGGGLAYADGRLYVGSGFGTLTALDAATGQEIWSQKLGNTATGAPSVRGGLVYVVSGDTTGWAIEADSGRVRWQVETLADVNNVAGSPAPAISDKFVTFGFGSGSVQTVFREGGLRLWNADILGRRTGVTLAGIEDLTGDPLIAGNRVYAANHSGRIVALNLGDGERIWTARQGALGPVWPLGSSVVFVSDRNQLVRLDADSGAQIWAVDLPGFVPRRNPNRRRDASFANHGPILAGGRLIVGSTDGALRAFAPEDGRLLQSAEIAGGATTRPVVAGGTLYVVSGKGVLHAFR